MVKIVYVATSIGERLGLDKKLDNRIHSSELHRVLRNSGSHDLLVLLDILHRYVEELKTYTSVEENKNIIFKAKGGPTLYCLKIFFENPLKQFIDDDRVLGFYIRDEHLSYRVVELPLSYWIELVFSRAPSILIRFLYEFKRLFKFALVGLTGFFVNLSIVYISRIILISFFTKEVATAFSSLIGFETSLTWNFMLHERWTFKDLGLSRSIGSRINRWFKFHLGSIGSMFTQVSTVTILSGFMDYPIYLSLFIGVSLGLLLNYTVSRAFTWGK